MMRSFHDWNFKKERQNCFKIRQKFYNSIFEFIYILTIHVFLLLTNFLYLRRN